MAGLDRLTPADGRGRLGWLALLVFVAAAAAHAPSLDASWVLDDRALARDHPAVQDGLGGIPQAFGDEAGRPLALVTFCLEAPLWHDEEDVPQAYGFHLTNLVLHGACAVLLLFVLLRLCPGRPWLAFGAALVFALHPLHVGTVSRIAGRADLLALLFGLIAVRVWIGGRPGMIPLAALAWLLALLSKETAVALPVVLLLVAPVRERALGWTLVLLAFVVWIVVWPGQPAATGSALAMAVEGLGRAALGLVIPTALPRDALVLTDGGIDLVPAALGWILGGALVLAAAVMLVRWKRASPVGLGLLAAAGVGLVGALVAPEGAPLATRFWYVAGFGLFLLTGRLVEALAARPVGVFGVVLVAFLLGTLSWQEARAWKDDGALHDALLERYPDRTVLLLRQAKQLREDIEADRLLAATRPMTDVKRKRMVAETSRRVAQAEALARAALRRTSKGEQPDHAASRAWRELGLVQLVGSRPADAVASLRAAIVLDPWLATAEAVAQMPPEHARVVADTYRALATAEESLGDIRESAAHFESALQFAPQDVDLMRRAGRALIRALRFDRGLRLLRRALDDPDLDADTRQAIEREFREGQTAARDVAERLLKEGAAAERAEQVRDAISAYERAVGADPTLLEAYGRLVNLWGLYLGNCRRGAHVLKEARAMMDEMGISSESPWRSRFDRLEAELEKECGDAED